ncbi:N-acetylhexosaminidase [Russula aff. rugulosa BPL654]|nr:N-acetylhexosaminidase [Russula aff. rugulosa BPL654]
MTPLLSLLTFLFLSLQGTFALWPQPTNLQTGTSALPVQRTRTYLFTDNLARLVPSHGAEDLPALSHAKALPGLTLRLQSQGEGDEGYEAVSREIALEAQTYIFLRQEEYTLNVPADGTGAVLSAASTLGLFRGLNTFAGLWYTYDYGKEALDQDGRNRDGNVVVYTLSAPVAIRDSPAYLNTFHWHIVDSQSFPLVVPNFQNISQEGAYSADSVYTPQDVAHIVSYAGARGIDVLVEIDTPGHTAVISKAHPEHVACAEASPWSTYANEPPAGQLRLASPETINFTVGLLSSVARLFPSTLFSTGGDEINARCYADDAQTQRDLNGRTLEQALDAFTQATHGALTNLGKTPVVWEEMVLNYNLTLSNDTIAMVWESSSHAAAVAAKGFHFIYAASNSFYLDCGAGNFLGNDSTGHSWCPFNTWQNAYTFDPVANLSSAQAKLVLGGQHLLWTEQSGPENLDPIVWPRAAASAEVFWSGPVVGRDASASGDRDLRTALPRLHELVYRFRRRGVHAISLQPEWCALRPFKCDLNA